jgi:hypothetical protein
MLTHTKGAIPGFTERERRSTLRELLRERARVLEVDPDDANEEAAAADAEAMEAEASAPIKKSSRGRGGDAADKTAEKPGDAREADEEEEDEGDEGDEDGDEEEECEEDEDDQDDDENGDDDNDEESGDDDDDDVEEAPEDSSSGGAAARGGDRNAAKVRSKAQKEVWGQGIGEEGLVDPAIFTRALEEAKRRARAAGME